MRQPTPARSSLFWTAACAGVVLIATLIADPRAETGVLDDFSFVRTARDAAETGHLLYNGWATMMQGVQAYLGAACIRLFGFSFTALRLTTVGYALAAVPMLFWLGRRIGLTRPIAAFGTLLILLAPPTIKLTYSFMTDIPGFVWGLAAMVCCVKAADATSRIRGLAWTLTAFSVGLLGGTIRPTTWLIPLLFLPWVAWVRRDDLSRAICAALCWLSLLPFIAFLVSWFSRQPYTVPEPMRPGYWIFRHYPTAPTGRLLHFGVTWCWLLLPLSALLIWQLCRHDPQRRLYATILSIWITAAALVWFLPPVATLAPSHYAFVSGNGDGGFVFERGIRIGAPRRLHFRWLLASAMLTVVGAALVRSGAARTLWRGILAKGPPSTEALLVPGAMLVLITLFLVIPRATAPVGLFHRYLIPCLPFLVFSLLLWLQHLQSTTGRAPHVPAFAWALLAFVVFFEAAQVHDDFARRRALVTAAQQLRNAGIPDSRISSDWPFDGWTQLELGGHLNDFRIKTPPGAYRRLGRTHPVAAIRAQFDMYELTPAIDAAYFLVDTPQPELRPSEYTSVPFSSFLPPHDRRIEIQRAAR